MNSSPQTPPLASWRSLQNRLAGSFTAQARGFLANVFVIQKNGSEIGRLLTDGTKSARFSSSSLEASIERTPDGGYEMFLGDVRLLMTRPLTASLETLAITVGENECPARISFLRNEAVASSPGRGELTRLEGGLLGRRYEVALEENAAAALPVAVLLLYLTATFRRRVYRA